MQIHVLRLSPGADLRPALEAAFAELARTHGITAGCILSAVGSLSRVVLRYAAEPDGTETVAPLELLTLSGTLSLDGAHLHASVSTAQGTVTGGHLMPGSVVRTTAEVVIALLPGWDFRRAVDATTGYRELVAARIR
jgi:uncharacterized protein